MLALHGSTLYNNANAAKITAIKPADAVMADAPLWLTEDGVPVELEPVDEPVGLRVVLRVPLPEEELPDDPVADALPAEVALSPDPDPAPLDGLRDPPEDTALVAVAMAEASVAEADPPVAVLDEEALELDEETVTFEQERS